MLLPYYSTFGQVILNDEGAYELKVVEKFDSIKAEQLYDQTLVVLSDILGSKEKSKFNIDVQDRQGGIIVYKGSLFMGYHKVNVSGGYDVLSDFTLKVRFKDGRAQYTIIVPSLTLVWVKGTYGSETIPLNEIYPEYTHKGKLSFLKKSVAEFSPHLDSDMRALQKMIYNKTSSASEDDF